MSDKKDTSSSDNSKIGYKNPPKHTRFKPGQSGNPGGRPKKHKPKVYHAQGLARLFVQTGNQEVQITKNGKALNTTMIQAVFEQIYRKAAQGDPRATKMVLDAQSRYLDILDKARYLAAENFIHLEQLHKDYVEQFRKDPKAMPFERVMIIQAYAEEFYQRMNDDFES